ncbi:MAG: glutaredoxin family protein [Terriglobia bacterium]
MPTNSASLPEVVLYTRAGCHLCEEAKEQIRSAQTDTPFAFREVDIDLDPELRARFNEEVPVIFIDGKKAFKYRLDLRAFRKRLKNRE